MIVLPPGVFCPKMIVRVQMFIDFVDVEKFPKQLGVPNNFHIKKIYKHSISVNHFGTKILQWVGQSFRDAGSMSLHRHHKALALSHLYQDMSCKHLFTRVLVGPPSGVPQALRVTCTNGSVFGFMRRNCTKIGKAQLPMRTKTFFSYKKR